MSTRKAGVVHGVAVRIERRATPDTEGQAHPCPWEYPIGGRACGAPVTTLVQYRVSGTMIWYCLNHAQREVLGGQAWYAGVPPVATPGEEG